MTAIPPYFAAPLFPGLQNNQMLTAEEARTLLSQASPDYQDPAKRPVLDAYLNQVIAEEAFVTPRRIVEVSAAARQYLGGDPSQLARARAVEQGKAVPFDRLPSDMAENYRRLGLSEEEVAEQVTRTTMYDHTDMTPQQKIEKFIRAAHMHPDSPSRPDIALAQMNAQQQAAAPPMRQVANPNTPVPSVRQNLDGSQSIRGVVYGQDG